MEKRCRGNVYVAQPYQTNCSLMIGECERTLTATFTTTQRPALSITSSSIAMILRAGFGRSLKAIETDPICSRCLSRLVRPSSKAPRRAFHSSARLEAVVPETPPHRRVFRRDYFSINRSLDDVLASRGGLLAAVTPDLTRETSKLSPSPSILARGREEAIETTASTSTINPTSPDSADLLPHRRRRKKATLEPLSSNQGAPLAPDASSRLTTLSTSLPPRSFRRTLATYLSLTKPRLSFLIVLTTTTAYSLYPLPEVLTPSHLTTPSLSPLTLLFLTTGTFLSCASANTLNQLFEPSYDALMSRTRNRPLVRKLVTPRSALLFAIATAVGGLTLLYYGTNPTVSFLSAANIAIYAFVYTPMKRFSVLNTWAGAIVGGIPPLMGWAAAAGETATPGHDNWRDLLFDPVTSVGGWLVAALLFAWQFPHFNALSTTIAEEYKYAGYRMLCWVNPAMNARVSLRYSILMFPICGGFYMAGVVDWPFLIVSTGINAWMLGAAWRFWREKGSSIKTARTLFWRSVWHLPVLLVGGLVCKVGLWDGVWRGIIGEGEEDVDEEVEFETPRNVRAV
jgi:heme o synthase